MSGVPVTEYLCGLHGKSVFFEPLYGNHGDQLIERAARLLLLRAAVSPVQSAGEADVIVVNGGGAMADGWFGLDKLAAYCADYPEIPIAVLPSSYHPDGVRLAQLTAKRAAPVRLWARERRSLEILQDAALPPSTRVNIDHDLAFHLADQPLITDLRAGGHKDHVLIVERDDWEGPTGRRRSCAPSGLDFIPQAWRTKVRQSMLGPLRRRQDRASPFRAAALEWLELKDPDALAYPVLATDISLAEVCGFEQFLDDIAGAACVVTTRLHVAIVSHLLGKKTWLVEGSYHKNRGVFEYSMQGGSTELLHWHDEKLEPDN